MFALPAFWNLIYCFNFRLTIVCKRNLSTNVTVNNWIGIFIWISTNAGITQKLSQALAGLPQWTWKLNNGRRRHQRRYRGTTVRVLPVRGTVVQFCICIVQYGASCANIQGIWRVGDILWIMWSRRGAYEVQPSSKVLE